jgi:hypothetical protein
MMPVLPAILLLASCGAGGGKQLNRRITLSRHDEIPYGAKVAYELLPHLFPDADLTTMNDENPVPTGSTSGAGRVLIVVSPSVIADDADVPKIMNFVQEGNQVFISANRISENLLKELSLRASNRQSFREEPDSLTVGVYGPVDAEFHRFSYPGDSYDNYITKLDTQYTSILGRDGRGRPNFVRLTYKGGGAIYLHFAPLAFSNFFLLHKKNIAYYENALSYLSPGAHSVIWDEYYRYDRTRGFSAFRYIFSSEALRLGFWLLLLLFLILYLFESKRRQRQIPVIPPLSNTSLDFVRTIGSLYFQRRDNHNLAMKMVTHFQDQVRTRFHLTVTAFDEAFVDRLAYRTGYPKQSLLPLVGYMGELPSKAYISDDELMDLHRQLEAFYKQT